MEVDYNAASECEEEKKDCPSSFSFTSPVKTNMQGTMSSSLKERLKKCGRYHPATPPTTHQYSSLINQKASTPCSHPTALTLSQQHTQSPAARLQSPQNILLYGKQGPLDSRCTSCPAEKPVVWSHACFASSSRKRKLLQPRNILAERSSLNSGCTNSPEIPGLSVENRSETATDSCTGQTDAVDEEGIACPQNPNSFEDCYSKSSSIPSVWDSMHTLSSNIHSKHAAPCVSNIRSVKENSPETIRSYSSSGDAHCLDLKESVKQTKFKLAERREVLRKLNMVKTYRAKNDLLHLQTLIDKWRAVCQRAILDLHQLTSDPRPSLTQLLQQLGVDPKLLSYDREEECFLNM